MAESDLPASYAYLPTKHIKLSHVPVNCPTVTKVVVIELNRPTKRNAWVAEMAKELETVYKLFDIDDRVRAIVLTGSGSTFCVGADLEVGFASIASKDDKDPAPSRDYRDSAGWVTMAMHNCRKSTVVAINGSAAGVGITVTLPAAIRVAYKDAKIGFVFARRGLIMEGASAFLLPKLIGHSRALHLVTTGAVYPASHPLLSDLFSEILPSPEATVARALEIATDIAENTSIISTAIMRDLIWRSPGSAEETHLLNSRLIWDMFGSADNIEGTKSFFEKPLRERHESRDYEAIGQGDLSRMNTLLI
ncbi:enoyl-CoA hydratase/isomerase family protein [Talaromyces stipitatus ATCC 10500]|uniref:Enoyl-CoA hydratase/isomerase family protein n=1 Tax=Talaromyces stipitatus (strain ATCC 10500 / CBS 375.48 / QM 6759 / NRRL 1006) TaxID=441959 RepID=B8M214_TALSN|nr:enoyl-CoA hydratase/isomerase family protein [Talaromyces stipitatus ATCC 10500]EED21392.1 enoyl-CoA hydratase/isomerase family protein [Talaromyces stipitatus ATCC 10500]